MQFLEISKTDTVTSVYWFGQNGLCLKILESSSSQGTVIETTPLFKVVKTKWLVVGWSVKIIKNGNIEAGYSVTLKNRQAGKIWVPIEIMISVQEANHAGKTFTDVLKLRNYLFDQSLQIIN